MRVVDGLRLSLTDDSPRNARTEVAALRLVIEPCVAEAIRVELRRHEDGRISGTAVLYTIRSNGKAVASGGSVFTAAGVRQ
jgi:hypothetical protein